jgi:hypothetical protein
LRGWLEKNFIFGLKKRKVRLKGPSHNKSRETDRLFLLKLLQRNRTKAKLTFVTFLNELWHIIVLIWKYFICGPFGTRNIFSGFESKTLWLWVLTYEITTCTRRLRTILCFVLWFVANSCIALTFWNTAVVLKPVSNQFCFENRNSSLMSAISGLRSSYVLIQTWKKINVWTQVIYF